MATQTQRFLQGEIVDGKFQIGPYLGGSEHSWVFLTQYGDLHPRDAAIKLVPAPAGAAEAQLSRWRLAANFSHPHLVQILDMGRCELGHAAMLYVVTELATENLAEIIPERRLSPDEAREVLARVLNALSFIHSRGFVHGHIKPANIMAVGEELKLSSDGICRLGEETELAGAASIYDPPEGNRNGASPAGDMWSLGMTLLEVLTQHVPAWTPADRKDPVLPESLPASFADIAHHCLRRNPKSRWSAAEVAAHLPRPTPGPAETLVVEKPARQGRPYPLAAAVLAVVLMAIFAGWKILGRHPADQQPQAAPPSAPLVTQEAPAPAQPARPEPAMRQPASLRATPSSTPPLTANSRKSLAPSANHEASQEARLDSPATNNPASPAPVPAAPTWSTAQAPSATEAASAAATPSAAAGTVLHQVIPEVPKKASETILGTVRVGVKISVDSSGHVTEAQLDSGGPSRYFANLSLHAARNWTFGPPTAHGTPIPSLWILHFNYTNSGTTVVPSQTLP
jgi:eukaryotic-like serine/threonine-protein kinase